MSRRAVNKLRSMAYVCGSASSLFAGFYFVTENEKFYDSVFVPLAHRLSPETAHRLAVKACKYGLLPKSTYEDPVSLRTKLWDLEFSNPVGMAAGFDKDGEAVECIHDVGFGFAEVGSVTPKPQPGNPKPRVFRLSEDRALINRYGFNSGGHAAVLERVQKLKQGNFKGVVGVNLGKNKDSADSIQDYINGISVFGPVSDYLVINISSPNTPGLREWQNKGQLKELLKAVVSARNSLTGRKPPLLLKLAPDLTDAQKIDIAKLVRKPECRVDGLIVSNTTTSRDFDLKEIETAQEAGGLSGQPLNEMSTKMIRQMYFLTLGDIPIIGVGGVFSGKDAYDKIKAGASLVQLYTAFVYHGPPIVTRIKRDLDELLMLDGYENVKEAVGADHKTKSAN